MRKSSKRLMSFIMIIQFLVVMLIWDSSVEVKADSDREPIINIKVSDSTGLITDFKYLPSSPNDKFQNPVPLKGNAYATFSVISSEYNKVQYKIVESIRGNAAFKDKTDWKDVDLTEQWKNNDDVMLDKKGYLKHKAYDVTYKKKDQYGRYEEVLGVKQNEANWNKRELVYAKEYSGSSIVSANIAGTAREYGNIEFYYDGNNKKSRFVNKTIFLKNTTGKQKIDDIIKQNTGNSQDMYREASKIWGYIKVGKTGEYNFKSFSDDGLSAYIMVDGNKKEIVGRSMFKVQGNTSYTYDGKVTLDSTKYYPIYIEYFNWGGDASFEMNIKESNEADSKYRQIPYDWFYPSKSDSPGEYAESVFTGTAGMKMPTEPGVYYIAYKAFRKNSNGSQEGTLGPYLVEPRAKLSLSRSIISSDGSEAPLVGDKYKLRDKDFKIKYQVIPLPIPAEEIIGNIENPSDINKAQEIYEVQISEPVLTVVLPSGLDYSNPNENGAVDVTGGKKSYNNLNISKIIYKLDKVNKVYNPITNPATFTHGIKAKDYGDYTLHEENSKISYKDIDGGSKEMKFNTQNILIDGVTEVTENGLYDIKTNKFLTINDKTKLTTLFPSTFAVKFKVNSLNPKITIKSDASNSYSFDLIKYEVNGNSLLNKQTKKIKGSSIEIFKDNIFTFSGYNEYLVVYKLRPNKAPKSGGKLNITVLDEMNKEKSNISIPTINPPNLK